MNQHLKRSMYIIIFLYASLVLVLVTYYSAMQVLILVDQLLVRC